MAKTFLEKDGKWAKWWGAWKEKKNILSRRYEIWTVPK
jgi:hypothetical protein